jgi:hypothetical protein
MKTLALLVSTFQIRTDHHTEDHHKDFSSGRDPEALVGRVVEVVVCVMGQQNHDVGLHRDPEVPGMLDQCHLVVALATSNSNKAMFILFSYKLS